MAEPGPVFLSPVRQASGDPDAPVRLTDVSRSVKVHVHSGASGAPSPVRSGFCERRDGGVVAAVTPGEWLVFAPGLDPAAAGEARDEEGAVDVTHARVLFRLTGEQASSVLEKVCALDFDDRFMPDGSAARTSIAKTTCEILRTDLEGLPSYLISTSRSYGGYLFDVLADAAVEFGGSQAPWDGHTL